MRPKRRNLLTDRQKRALQRRLVEAMASRAKDRREPATGEPDPAGDAPKNDQAQSKTAGKL